MVCRRVACREQAAQVSGRGTKKSPLLKKTKCFHTGCKCIRLSKSKGGWGGQEDGGSPAGFHGDDSNGYSRYSDCLVYVCDAGNERLGGWEFFWGGRDRSGRNPRAI